ncbi:hypothetical protein [Microbacterium algeriense]|uniref:SbsA Ig-like domain-containing protein n=1 Tax=Microbacterium algeriense TaxID=2615184 RepID=A0ABQ6VAE3_9MICO|nr:hypothetical protein [Microbacterium algeriense]KAB1867343.1 hypothetical protein F6A08_06030 [Microbacterium algeriense]
MALVKGNVATFGLESISLASAELRFIPSSMAVTGTKYLLSSRPVPVTVAADGSGAFSVNLMPSDATRPSIYYMIQLEALDAAGNFTTLEFPDWKLYVPADGGDIAALLATSLLTNAGMVWVDEDPPENPAARTGWLVTDPESADYGWYMEWEN